MLRIDRPAYLELLSHLLDGLPDEGCGLLSGGIDTDGVVHAHRFHPSANLAASSRVYTVDPRSHLRADRDAEDAGHEIIGVVHSHTHTEPYPSPTDVQQAPDPTWHYVIVSFRLGVPALRSFRIVDGSVAEEAVEVLTG